MRNLPFWISRYNTHPTLLLRETIIRTIENLGVAHSSAFQFTISFPCWKWLTSIFEQTNFDLRFLKPYNFSKTFLEMKLWGVFRIILKIVCTKFQVVRDNRTRYVKKSKKLLNFRFFHRRKSAPLEIKI